MATLIWRPHPGARIRDPLRASLMVMDDPTPQPAAPHPRGRRPAADAVRCADGAAALMGRLPREGCTAVGDALSTALLTAFAAVKGCTAVEDAARHRGRRREVGNRRVRSRTDWAAAAAVTDASARQAGILFSHSLSLPLPPPPLSLTHILSLSHTHTHTHTHTQAQTHSATQQAHLLVAEDDAVHVDGRLLRDHLRNRAAARTLTLAQARAGARRRTSAVSGLP